MWMCCDGWSEWVGKNMFFFYDGEILAESWGKMGKSRKAAAVLIMWLDMVGVFFFRGHFHEPHMAVQWWLTARCVAIKVGTVHGFLESALFGLHTSNQPWECRNDIAVLMCSDMYEWPFCNSCPPDTVRLGNGNWRQGGTTRQFSGRMLQIQNPPSSICHRPFFCFGVRSGTRSSAFASTRCPTGS